MRMMNSESFSLDHILFMGNTSKAWEGISYQKELSSSKPAVQKKNSRPNPTKIEKGV